MILLKSDISMETPDPAPSRLERAHLKITDLAEARKGQPLGLIAYASSSHLVLPPTQDTAVVAQKAAEIAKKARIRHFSLAPSRALRAFVPILLLLPLGVQTRSGPWVGLWLTPNQQGQRYFQRGEYVEAALAFQDPMWQGAAWYRAGEFEKAAQAFARRDTADARFNQGNAWLMRGKYETAIVFIRPRFGKAARLERGR